MRKLITCLAVFGLLTLSPMLAHADTTVPAAASTPPTPPPTNIAAPTTVPLTVLSNGKFAVDAMIDGKGPYSLLVDTGSEVMVLKSSVAQAIGLTVKTGTVQVQGPTGGFVPVGQADIDTVTIAGLDLKKPFCTVEDLNLPCDGLIGAPLFNAGVVRMDLAANKLTTYTAGYSPAADELERPLHFGKQRVPIIDGVVGGIDAMLEIDTGSSFPVELNSDFVDDHDLTKIFTKLGTVAHTSISGAANADVYDMQSLAFGPGNAAKVRGKILALFLPASGAPKRDFDGRVGCPILTGTVMTFDYASSKMYLRVPASATPDK